MIKCKNLEFENKKSFAPSSLLECREKGLNTIGSVGFTIFCVPLVLLHRAHQDSGYSNQGYPNLNTHLA